MREGRARVGFEASLLAKLETCSRKPVLTNRELLLPMRVVVWGEQGVGGAPTIAVPICRRVVVGGRSRTVTEVRRDLGHRPAGARPVRHMSPLCLRERLAVLSPTRNGEG